MDAEESVKRANARIKTSAEEMLRETVHGYSSVTTESTHIDLSDGKAKYALYPVWLLNTTWKDKKYLFAMNGQTGKFVGDLPVDRKAYWLWWLLFFAIFGVLAFFILGFFL